jgi:hypothetical protein
MIIKCDKHGPQSGLEVSSDIANNVRMKSPVNNLVIVSFEYLDDIVHTYYLSRDYAQKYKLENNMVIPLPDNYPDWVLGLVPLCKKCLLEIAPDVLG